MERRHRVRLSRQGLEISKAKKVDESLFTVRQVSLSADGSKVCNEKSGEIQKAGNGTEKAGNCKIAGNHLKWREIADGDLCSTIYRCTG